ncbi:hypothetical protein EBR96_10650, partial [bacterium]|nr:hypothetical protein [bacterium]
LAASGRNFTVFVPEMGGGPDSGYQDWQLSLVARGRYNAAALKALATAGEWPESVLNCTVLHCTALHSKVMLYTTLSWTVLY